MNPFDYIKAVSETKQNIISGTDNDELAEKAYNPFIINRGLSFYPDTILYANELNRRPLLDKKPQFLYLLNTLRPRKRYTKWLKEEKNEEIEIVSEYFGYSRAKAKDVIKILSSDQLKIIKTRLEKGGANT